MYMEVTVQPAEVRHGAQHEAMKVILGTTKDTLSGYALCTGPGTNGNKI